MLLTLRQHVSMQIRLFILSQFDYFKPQQQHLHSFFSGKMDSSSGFANHSIWSEIHSQRFIYVSLEYGICVFVCINGAMEGKSREKKMYTTVKAYTFI